MESKQTKSVVPSLEAINEARCQVESELERHVHCAAELLQEDGSYLVGWVTEYDDVGNLVDDPVEALRAALPPGWDVAWTGNGNGAEEDFRVQRKEVI